MFLKHSGTGKAWLKIKFYNTSTICPSRSGNTYTSIPFTGKTYLTNSVIQTRIVSTRILWKKKESIEVIWKGFKLLNDWKQKYGEARRVDEAGTWTNQTWKGQMPGEVTWETLKPRTDRCIEGEKEDSIKYLISFTSLLLLNHFNQKLLHFIISLHRRSGWFHACS